MQLNGNHNFCLKNNLDNILIYNKTVVKLNSTTNYYCAIYS